MKQNKLKLGIAFLLFCIGGITQAQEAITATGGDASGSGGSVSYTVGQVAYSYASNGGSVSQGVQQAYNITTVLGADMKSISLNVSVYPNPTVDRLTLTVNEDDFASKKALVVQLYNMDGKLLRQKKVEGESTSIEMKELRTATYYLRVLDNENTVKTFKIIKN